MTFTNRLLGALICASCTLSAPAALRAEDGPLNIHVILPLTGHASFLGSAEQASLQVAEKAAAASGGIHGRMLHFVFHDDQSKPQVAVQTATEVLAEKPAVVIGSAIVATCNAIAPMMKHGPVLYCLSPGVYPAAGDFMFTSSASTADLVTTQIRYWRNLGITKIALINSTDSTGQDAAKNVRNAIANSENAGLELVADVSFNPGDVSVGAQIQRIGAAKPQAVIAWSTGAAIGTVFKGLVDAGLDIPVATTDGNMTFAQMTQYEAILPKQLYIASPLWGRDASLKLSPDVEAAQTEFYKNFSAAGLNPDIAAVLSWDPAMLLVHTLRETPEGASAEQIRAYLAGLTGFAGISGIYDFRKAPQRGLDDSSVVVTRWNAGQKAWQVVSRPRGLPLN